ncbi:hypothetical protein BDR07DRAFT_1380330 [Suillus spraguei]|nr:hypothetical protein BDR07DRAFT_1380330 [Suillus spraguei]
MTIARNRSCLYPNTYPVPSSPQVESHVHLTQNQALVYSAEPGCNQTFTKFVDFKRHEVAHLADDYIRTWPGTGEKRYICPHNDYDYEAHDSALFICYRQKQTCLKRAVVIDPPQKVRRN